MAKQLISIRINKEDINFIKAQSQKNHVSQAKVIHEALMYYRDNQNLRILSDLDQKHTKIIWNFYNKVMPISFILLASYFYFRHNALFLLFIFIAFIPFIFELNIEDINTFKITY